VRAPCEQALSNAIKYTHPGDRVTVTMEARAAEAGTHVADTGQGLSAADLAGVFSSYRRLSARPTGDEPSTGLGLAIAKKIIDARGGRIWVESELGRG
jgi:signal transduction histidine kinase